MSANSNIASHKRMKPIRWSPFGQWLIIGFFLVVSSSKTEGASAVQVERFVANAFGGWSADPDRYPYFVSLADLSLFHKCGGSLIAPDIVVTSAQCQDENIELAVINLYDPFQTSGYETIPVIEQIVHPDFDPVTLENDQMVLRLHSPSSKQWVRLDLGGSLDLIGQGITSLGYGRSILAGDGAEITLQQVLQFYLPSSLCEISSGSISYVGAITADMMCIDDDVAGSCNMDRGVPLIIPGDAADNDTQVGISSWGDACESSIFPQIGSRTRSTQFIRESVCAHSDNPPAYMACERQNIESTSSPTMSAYPTTSPAPSPAPQIRPTASVWIFFIFFGNSDFITWSITDDEDGTIVASSGVGDYMSVATATEQLVFSTGQTYTLRIEDTTPDVSSRRLPQYAVVLADAIPPLHLLEGDGDFNSTSTQTFFVPMEGEGPPTMTTEEPNMFMTPTINPTISTYPSEIPIMEPTSEPIDESRSCIERGGTCGYHTDCCSGRCFLSLCRTSVTNRSTTKTSLRRDGVGGAGGGSSVGNTVILP